MGIGKEISTASKGGYGTAVLYAGMIGLLLSDIIPTPADALYFKLEQSNKKKLENNEITPKQYWTRDAVAYYGLNPIWWAIVLGITVSVKGDTAQKLKVAGALIGGGLVFGVLNSNIKKDKKITHLKSEL